MGRRRLSSRFPKRRPSRRASFGLPAFLPGRFWMGGGRGQLGRRIRPSPAGRELQQISRGTKPNSPLGQRESLRLGPCRARSRPNSLRSFLGKVAVWVLLASFPQRNPAASSAHRPFCPEAASWNRPQARLPSVPRESGEFAGEPMDRDGSFSCLSSSCDPAPGLICVPSRNKAASLPTGKAALFFNF